MVSPSNGVDAYVIEPSVQSLATILMSKEPPRMTLLTNSLRMALAMGLEFDSEAGGGGGGRGGRSNLIKPVFVMS
jgi:hypothetical protein